MFLGGPFGRRAMNTGDRDSGDSETRRDRRTLQLARNAPSPGPQSAQDDETSYLLEQLASVEDPVLAERVERLLGDAELVSQLQWVGFDPETAEWRKMARTLAEYGYAVFKGWAYSGSLHRMAANHSSGKGVYGYQRIPETLQLRGDDAHALVAELMITSIEAFRRKTLMHPDPAKRWRPTGGASLRTFFVGRCLMELPDVYAKWARSEARAAAELERYADLVDRDSKGEYSADPGEQAIASARVDEVLGGVGDSDGEARTMFLLQQEGYSLIEIAEMLQAAGIEATEASVRSRMSRVRVMARRARG